MSVEFSIMHFIDFAAICEGASDGFGGLSTSLNLENSFTITSAKSL